MEEQKVKDALSFLFALIYYFKYKKREKDKKFNRSCIFLEIMVNWGEQNWR